MTENIKSNFFFFAPILPTAEVPMIRMAAYCSTKAALAMFSSIARLELSKWGVKVAIIQPGGFQTSRYLRPRAL